MTQNTCQSCHYYRQHYTFNQRRIFRIHCGHCTHMRPKRKVPTSPCCAHFRQAEPDVSAFVSKEYLSKALLEYLLSLELLPEITNTAGERLDPPGDYK